MIIRNMKNVAAEIASNRRSAIAESKRFAVRSLTKAGTVSKSADHPLNMVNSEEEATSRMAELVSMNPGRKFVVVAL